MRSSPSFRGTREISWFILACGLGSIVLGAFVITRRALMPLNELALAPHNILESGDLALRVPERGTADDLDQLAVLFKVLGMLTTRMDITGAETGAMHLEKRPEDLGSIAREAVDLYEHVSNERGVHARAEEDARSRFGDRQARMGEHAAI
jgi:HAMP domain-containing protein